MFQLRPALETTKFKKFINWNSVPVLITLVNVFTLRFPTQFTESS